MKIQVVTAAGKQRNYFINWAYKHKSNTVETYCNIFEDKELISKGKTYVHKGDSFEKKFGRKVALAKALKNLSDESALPYISKSERTQIWNTYRSIVNDKK